jgi:hypothetical protein
MTFFNSISSERKLQIVESRISSLKEQLWTLLIDAEILPETFDVNTFNPDTDISEKFSYLREQYTNITSIIEKMEQVKLGIE